MTVNLKGCSLIYNSSLPRLQFFSRCILEWKCYTGIERQRCKIYNFHFQRNRNAKKKMQITCILTIITDVLVFSMYMYCIYLVVLSRLSPVPMVRKVRYRFTQVYRANLRVKHWAPYIHAVVRVAHTKTIWLLTFPVFFCQNNMANLNFCFGFQNGFSKQRVLFSKDGISISNW